jgi:DNA-binding NtrC family response regulator
MAATRLRILLIDDDPSACAVLKANLGARPGIDVECTKTPQEALDRLSAGEWHAVIAEAGPSGPVRLEMVRRIRARDAHLPIIILSDDSAVERVVEGVRAGATEYLVKPIDPAAVIARLEEAARARPEPPPAAADQAVDDTGVLGAHPRLDEVREFAHRLAAVPHGRVLITGPTGTGKSLLARAIHRLSDVRGEFVVLNCAALPEHLLESELFGHEAGAFTDARSLKRGLIELAHEGPLFLDEIGSLPLALQAKLLLFLESQQVRRIGGMRTHPIRTRIIAATNENLRARVRARTFRADLLYRLDVAAIAMPALREMPDLIPFLARHFIGEFARELGRPPPSLDRASEANLVAHPWPGNVRELRNVVERALIFHDDGPIALDPRSDPAMLPQAGVQLPYGLTLEEVEQRYIRQTMDAFPNADLIHLAARFGISRKSFWHRRRKYGL